MTQLKNMNNTNKSYIKFIVLAKKKKIQTETQVELIPTQVGHD